ncbi:hypothetical protein TGMAS_224740 [Toxoplasma gondii MAS]|uniref:DUF3752 domain-containing protein n=1 Tax=Toxoplasma gondii MAS TaxID=943118 RepID=A0A086QMN0_TOXGO|nr:hypothetical protein TGMAS_224740 [Toxoplasma gondii MAS]
MRKKLREETSDRESASEEDRKKRRRNKEDESSDSSSSSESEKERTNKKATKKSKKKEKKKKKKKKKGKSFGSHLEDAPPPYDEFEVRRLLTGLLKKSRFLDTELEGLFSNLDDKQSVFLDGLPDATLRKKLRHLFRALRLEEVREDDSVGFKKGKTLSSLSLRRVVRALCREIKASLPLPEVECVVAAASSPGCARPTENPTEGDGGDTSGRGSGDTADATETIAGWRTGDMTVAGPALPPGFDAAPHQDEKDSDEDVEFCGPSAPEAEGAAKRAREEWMLEAPAYLKKTFATNSKMEKIMEQKRREDAEAEQMRAAMEEWNRKHRAKSLREMAETGEVEDGREMYKKWKQAMWAQNLWGKSAAEQRAVEEGKDEPNAGQPWRRFDRERDLDTRQTSREDYNKLVAKASELNSRFTSTWQSSFL